MQEQPNSSEPMAPSPRLSSLTFNSDGTIDPAQLEGLPEELVARITSPEFVVEARKRIQVKRVADEIARRRRGRRQMGESVGRRMVPFLPADKLQPNPHRRPAEISGRQRKRLRREVRAAMKMERGRLQNESSQ